MSRPRVSKTAKTTIDKSKTSTEWPAVVYFGMIGLGFLSYAIVEIGFRERYPHPIHWLGGLIGGVLGGFAGWLWYRWRGDAF